MIKNTINLLIIEDNEAQREALEEFCSQLSLPEFSESIHFTYKIYTAADLSQGIHILQNHNINLILSDLFLPDGTGIELLHKLKKQNKTYIPCIILTAGPSIKTAVDAIQNGAKDYISKPVDFQLLSHKIKEILETEHLREENQALRDRLQQENKNKKSKVLGNSPTIRKIYQKIKQIASTDVTVLLEGESGTGKQVFANLIYETSTRKNQKFIQVNCGALTKTLLEAELFGVVKGAYTGAHQSRAGYLESANGGTIFLDEIGEMDLESQVRLLRCIEERQVVRVGSTSPIDIDIRIIAATNQDLLQRITEGKFREDLYYRLGVMKITLPRLRDRREDIPLLFNAFVIEFNEKYNKSITTLSVPLLNFFKNYHWPGNIREFRNTLESMVILAKEDILDFDDLPMELKTASQNGRKVGVINYHNKNLKNSIIPKIPLKEYEKAIIERNLKLFSYNKTRTAEILGISSRNIYRKIKDYELDAPTLKND